MYDFQFKAVGYQITIPGDISISLFDPILAKGDLWAWGAHHGRSPLRYWTTLPDVGQAKGYPDLTSRSFLHYVNANNPNLPILGLMDLDPDGVSILRCYRHGSKRLSHEVDACTPSIH